MVVMLKILSLKLLILRSEELPTDYLVKTQLPILMDAKKAVINMLRSNHAWTYFFFIIPIGMMTNKNRLRIQKIAPFII
jgi:hypothetical protein